MKRNFLLDNLKGILIFLVVFGHSMELMRNDFIGAKILYIFIYLFHMPAFVFISGYFSKNLNKGRDTAVKSLLMIFIIFNTIWNTIALLAGKIDVFSFLMPGWALWYILSMFFWRMFLPDLVKVKNIFVISLIFGIIARMFTDFGTLLSLSRTITFLPFFLAGYFLKDIDNLRRNKGRKILSVIIMILIVVLAVYLAISKIIPTELLWGDRPYSNFNNDILVNILAAIASYIIGFLAIYALVNLTPQKRKRALSKIGVNTFPVYLLHTYLIFVIIGINIFISNYYLKLMVAFVGSIVITFLLSRDKVVKVFNKFIAIITGAIVKKER
ncbi:MAG: acyltransferase family protein [Sarcina sp.]